MTGDSNIEVVLRAIHETLADDGVAVGLYNLGEGAVGMDRKVLWVPVRFICDNNKQSTLSTGDLFTESLVIECHVYSSTFAEAEELRARVLNAVRRTMGTASQAVDGVYAFEKLDDGTLVWGDLSYISQRFNWAMQQPRIEDAIYPVRVRQIDVVDGTQFTAADGALKPTEQLEITEQD